MLVLLLLLLLFLANTVARGPCDIVSLPLIFCPLCAPSLNAPRDPSDPASRARCNRLQPFEPALPSLHKPTLCDHPTVTHDVSCPTTPSINPPARTALSPRDQTANLSRPPRPRARPHTHAEHACRLRPAHIRKPCLFATFPGPVPGLHINNVLEETGHRARSCSVDFPSSEFANNFEDTLKRQGRPPTEG